MRKYLEKKMALEELKASQNAAEIIKLGLKEIILHARTIKKLEETKPASCKDIKDGFGVLRNKCTELYQSQK